MKALYLYFAGTATQGRGSSPAPGDGRTAADPHAIDEGPLVPIQPGAFSRWMANRDRAVSENAATLRSQLDARRSRGAQSPESIG